MTDTFPRRSRNKRRGARRKTGRSQSPGLVGLELLRTAATVLELREVLRVVDRQWIMRRTRLRVVEGSDE